MAVVSNKLGGRTVQLFIPFEHGGKTIFEIVLSPFRFGDTLRWGEGEFPTSLALLTELAGVDEAVIRDLRYPDVDRVMSAFIDMLPQDLRDDIANGRVPVKRGQATPAEPATPTPPAEPYDEGTVLASPGPITGPGEPLPEAGFDMSEEP
jgi:hypothetical protein